MVMELPMSYMSSVMLIKLLIEIKILKKINNPLAILSEHIDVIIYRQNHQ